MGKPWNKCAAMNVGMDPGVSLGMDIGINVGSARDVHFLPPPIKKMVENTVWARFMSTRVLFIQDGAMWGCGLVSGGPV